MDTPSQQTSSQSVKIARIRIINRLLNFLLPDGRRNLFCPLSRGAQSTHHNASTCILRSPLPPMQCWGLWDGQNLFRPGGPHPARINIDLGRWGGGGLAERVQLPSMMCGLLSMGKFLPPTVSSGVLGGGTLQQCHFVWDGWGRG